MVGSSASESGGPEIENWEPYVNEAINTVMAWNDILGPVPPAETPVMAFPFDFNQVLTREDVVADNEVPDAEQLSLPPFEPTHFDLPNPGNTPVLLMSGGLDMQTPIYWADELETHWKTTSPDSTVVHARFPFLPHVVVPIDPWSDTPISRVIKLPDPAPWIHSSRFWMPRPRSPRPLA